MDREIKFSIAYKSPNTDEPNKWFISEPLTIQEIMFGDDTQVDFTDGSYLRFHELNDGESIIIFRQYTGQKDSKDKEVWEGDIVRELYDPENVKVVKFDNGSFHWFPYWEDSTDYEVIGNRFENPELLDQVKNLNY